MNADEVHQLLQRLQQEGFAAVQPGLDEDDKQPYEKRYQQAAALQVQIQALSGPGSPPGAAEPLDLAALRVQRGVVLLETDLLPEAEASVAAGLATLEQAVGALQPPQEDAAAPPPQQVALAAAQGEHVVLLQAAYNGLGALWSRRGDLPAALAWLTKAETLASWAIAEARRLAAAAAPEQQRPPAENGHAPGAPGEGRPSDAAETPAAPLDGWAAAAEELEAGFTTTLFFLAQVHGHAADRHRSAHYCAATLQRQLLPPAAAALNRSEWVQNCVQLAGFYVAEGALGVARHCLAAARLVAAGLPNNSAPGAGEPPGSDPPPQPPQPAVEPPDWGHMVVDSDVVANLRLAHAKLHREALRRAHAAHVLGQPAPGPAQDEAPLQAPAFASLAPHLPPAPAGEEAEEPQQLAGSFEAARELFNRGMTEYNAALGFYQLDGWVTEHVNILLETSGLLRCAACCVRFRPAPLSRVYTPVEQGPVWAVARVCVGRSGAGGWRTLSRTRGARRPCTSCGRGGWSPWRAAR